MTPQTKKTLNKLILISRHGRINGCRLAKAVLKHPDRYPELVAMAHETLRPTIQEESHD